jgi:acetyltransferase-like isoleucine patch superfamily enzyme
MKISITIRIISLPYGLIVKLWNLTKEGARDFQNQIRFKGAKIDTGSCINERSKIAPNTHILSNCIINNSIIAPYTYVGKNCLIQNTNIGKFCSIANDVFIGLGKHPTYLISTSTLFYRTKNTLDLKLIEKDIDFDEYGQINIGNDVWIGARAILMDGVTVGNGAIIAANSVVTKDIPPYAIVGGVPAKVIKYRFPDNKIEELQRSAWWNCSFEEIKQKLKEPNNLFNDHI